MALVIDISINRAQQVATIAAVRVEGTTDPDSDGTYRVDMIRGETLHQRLGLVQHRYGDGALTLATKAFTIAEASSHG